MAFALREYELVKGKQSFYELLKDEKSLLNKFVEEIQSNSQYASEYKTILAYMNMVAANISVPITKYKPLKGNKMVLMNMNSDLNIYEFIYFN